MTKVEKAINELAAALAEEIKSLYLDNPDIPQGLSEYEDIETLEYLDGCDFEDKLVKSVRKELGL